MTSPEPNANRAPGAADAAAQMNGAHVPDLALLTKLATSFFQAGLPAPPEAQSFDLAAPPGSPDLGSLVAGTVHAAAAAGAADYHAPDIPPGFPSVPPSVPLVGPTTLFGTGAPGVSSTPGVPVSGVPRAPGFPEVSALPAGSPAALDLSGVPFDLAGVPLDLTLPDAWPVGATAATVPTVERSAPPAAADVSSPVADSTPSPPAAPAGLDVLEFRPVLEPRPGEPRSLHPNLLREDFPILQEPINGHRLIWLDNAATTQKPRSVIDRLTRYYEHENSNVHRAAHTLAARSTDAYEEARKKVADFLNASDSDEIVWVRGTTEAINLVANAWGKKNVGLGDEVLITWLEHHANLVPWQMLCNATGATLKVAPVDDSGQIILSEYHRLLTAKTKLVAFTQVSNALGTITPAHEMVEIAHRVGARVLVDGAQSVPHLKVDVQELDCDFFVFSGHKLFAPTGIGVLYGKADALADMLPWQGGGNMIADVTHERTLFQPPPFRFEAGTGSIADAVALRTAIEYVESLGLDAIAAHEHDLLEYGTKELRRVPGLHLIGTATTKAAIWSFVLDGHHTEDVAAALDAAGIAVRAGHHCAQPTLRRFGVEATVRPSVALYNTHEDLDALVDVLLRLQSGAIEAPPRGGRYYVDSALPAGGVYHVDPYRC